MYDASSHELSCASCNPDGDPPVGGARLLGPQYDGYSDIRGSFPEAYDPNSVSDSGQVFFDTPDALLPADTNGKQDVYEYKAAQLHLLSGGTTADNSWFVNATSGGSDAFFVTSQQLLPQDGDTSPDLYDARIDGGLPPPSVASAPCVGDACRPAAGAGPPPPLAASVTFFGPGNSLRGRDASGRQGEDPQPGRARLELPGPRQRARQGADHDHRHRDQDRQALGRPRRHLSAEGLVDAKVAPRPDAQAQVEAKAAGRLPAERRPGVCGDRLAHRQR